MKIHKILLSLLVFGIAIPANAMHTNAENKKINNDNLERINLEDDKQNQKDAFKLGNLLGIKDYAQYQTFEKNKRNIPYLERYQDRLEDRAIDTAAQVTVELGLMAAMKGYESAYQWWYKHDIAKAQAIQAVQQKGMAIQQKMSNLTHKKINAIHQLSSVITTLEEIASHIDPNTTNTEELALLSQVKETRTQYAILSKSTFASVFAEVNMAENELQNLMAELQQLAIESEEA